MKLIFYVLVHEHEYGQSLYGFYYEPTRNRPYPNAFQVIEQLGIHYEPQLDERVSLHTLEGGEPDLVLLAADVGCREPVFLELGE